MLGIHEIFHAFIDSPNILLDILLFLRQNPHVAAPFSHLYKLVIHQSLCIPLCLQRTHLYSLFPPFTSLSNPSILSLCCHTLNGLTKTDLCTLCFIVGPIQYVIYMTECFNLYTIFIWSQSDCFQSRFCFVWTHEPEPKQIGARAQ